MRYEGYVSKKAIRYWLENYESLVAGDRPFDEIPGNSGPSEYDGVYMNQLNKIMLDKAVDNLPKDLKVCVKNRWYRGKVARETCNELGITKDVYYSKCGEALDSIYEELSGGMIGVNKLLQQLK